MNAYAAVTDRNWFDFLAELHLRKGVNELNFWRPSTGGGHFGVLHRGEPFLFKLRAPTNMIVGGGFFEYYTALPLSLAWNAFGTKNGAESRQALWDRIASHRRSNPAWYEDFEIGCIVLVEPFFWPEDLWIPQPEDWSPNIVRGKTYDLTVEPGRSLWERVAERLQASDLAAGSSDDETDQLELPGGYTEVPMRRRIGQGTFSLVVTDAYDRECAVTHERALPALEAAHIKPYAEEPVHDPKNGLLLRSDVHHLFDAGYLTVTPDHRVEASRRMREDFNDGENYMKMHGSEIFVPRDPEYQPDPDALEWHNENKFRG